MQTIERTLTFFCLPRQHHTDDTDKPDFGFLAFSTPVRFFVRLQVSLFLRPGPHISRESVSRRSQGWPVRWRHGRLRGFQATP
ncbi:MAG: hypothetical protein E5X37_33605 [Mesorhizobium sp.]|uniref:hypothetical protein n=1 Tax=Mesorhizobium sp. TaxID=1871066 RepID=UPI001203B159|nr:hypothetical protein [Mesorhizobium sp.]TIR02766.1 MAG: hypothetical protein E5X37_33605 [Mesorhizobium sp.]